uniref:RING-type domain-containing protein n=1 Tax=Caenorhabditis japonica TaxID=281687 RepID=A0A8R1E1X2_CAEJA
MSSEPDPETAKLLLKIEQLTAENEELKQTNQNLCVYRSGMKQKYELLDLKATEMEQRSHIAAENYLKMQDKISALEEYITHYEQEFQTIIAASQKENEEKTKKIMLLEHKLENNEHEERDEEMVDKVQYGPTQSYNKIPTCEICASEFNNQVDRNPRVLACGHTLCISCANRIAGSDLDQISCPFDRKITQLEGFGVSKLAKNFTVCQLLSD